ncbi:acetyltransferase [Candidatus Bipolaricaulota bacterium]
MGIAIVGAGGHGRVALECMELSGALDAEVVFFDDRWSEIDAMDGVEVLGPVSVLASDDRYRNVFVGIGDNRDRLRITNMLVSAGKTLLTVVHPKTMISPRSALGVGTLAVAGTVVNRDARVGNSVILNTSCTVGHDCVVEDFAQISPGVNLGGAAVIERGAFLGIGVKVGPEARVGAWSVVGAGAVVLRDLPPQTFCIGIPARAVRPLRPDELPDTTSQKTGR